MKSAASDNAPPMSLSARDAKFHTNPKGCLLWMGRPLSPRISLGLWPARAAMLVRSLLVVVDHKREAASKSGLFHFGRDA